MEEANYVVILPADYLHVLNCTAHFAKKCDNGEPKKCKPDDDDSFGGIFSLCRRLSVSSC